MTSFLGRCFLTGLALLSAASVVAQGALADPERPQYVERAYDDDADLDAIRAFVSNAEGLRDQLNAAGRLLLRSRQASTRQEAYDTLSASLYRHLADTGGYNLPLEGLAALSVKSDPANAWKLYTYQHFVDDSTYVYGGLLHIAERPSEPIVLHDRAQAQGMENDFELTPEQWYGAVYYAVEPFKRSRDRDAWLLFGYDADGFFHRRKVVDVLTFNGAGEPRFGAEVFKGVEGRPSASQSRLIFEYRVDARVGVHYDYELGGIAFDHLVPGPPIVAGAPPSMVPDGSYDGYVLDEETGTWQWRMEWFDRVVSPEAPRPQPVLDGDSDQPRRDLFGRVRGSGGQ